MRSVATKLASTMVPLKGLINTNLRELSFVVGYYYYIDEYLLVWISQLAYFGILDTNSPAPFNLPK